jgi:SAM-dependent methyltransferase
MQINEKIYHLNDRVQWEFKCIEKYLKGHGVDVGCGTNRLSPDILSLDQQPDKRYAHADVVHDCHDLEYNTKITFKDEDYEFKDGEFDFIFSSHCLEDFEDIPVVFLNWWKKLKPNGLMLLLLPDMQGGRYPTVEDYKGSGIGNPAHKTNVGKEFMFKMLKDLDLEHEIVQVDTLPHDKTCTIDFVIRKQDKEQSNG